MAASHAGSVRARSVAAAEVERRSLLVADAVQLGAELLLRRTLGSEWQAKHPASRKSFSPFSARVWLTRSGVEEVLGSVEVAQLVFDVGHDVARLAFREVIARHPRPRVERLRIAQEREQPAPCREEATFDSSGAEPFPFPSTVWQEMQRDSEKSFLPLAALPGGLLAGGLDPARELPGDRLVEEVVRELLDLLVGEVEVRHRGVGIDRPRPAQPVLQPHSPPVFMESVASGGASDRKLSWPRTAWQA